MRLQTMNRFVPMVALDEVYNTAAAAHKADGKNCVAAAAAVVVKHMEVVGNVNETLDRPVP